MESSYLYKSNMLNNVGTAWGHFCMIGLTNVQIVEQIDRHSPMRAVSDSLEKFPSDLGIMGNLPDGRLVRLYNVSESDMDEYNTYARENYNTCVWQGNTIPFLADVLKFDAVGRYQSVSMRAGGITGKSSGAICMVKSVDSGEYTVVECFGTMFPCRENLVLKPEIKRAGYPVK